MAHIALTNRFHTKAITRRETEVNQVGINVVHGLAQSTRREEIQLGLETRYRLGESCKHRSDAIKYALVT